VIWVPFAAGAADRADAEYVSCEAALEAPPPHAAARVHAPEVSATEARAANLIPTF
jgi:hypothetical protein